MSFKHFANFLKQKRAFFSVSILTLSTLTLLIFFQNCGKAGFDSANDGTSSIHDPSKTLPFAFDASIDMITYNSCSSPNSQGKTFSFKVGSYQSSAAALSSSSEKVPKSGVRLSDDFANYIKNSLKPDYPNPDVTTEQVQKLLAKSDLNSEAQLQISLRSINKGNRLGNVFFKSSGPAIGIDVIQLLGDLTDLRWADAIIAGGLPTKSSIQYADFFPKAAGTARNIEASFHYNTNYQTAEAYRNAFNKTGDIDAQIVVGFSYTNEAILISPENATQESDLMTTAYGRGYQLGFQVPVDSTKTPSSWAYHPNNQVASVTEYDLLTNRAVSGAAWDCNARFKIVRAEDASFSWNALSAAIDTAVQTDSGIAAGAKESTKAGLKYNMAGYYQFLDGNGNVNINVSTGQKVDTTLDAAGLCPKMDYSTLSVVPNQNSIYGVGVYAGKTYGEILEIVRRHLPDNEWDVNLAYGCVVPKKHSCYPDESRKATEGGTYTGLYKVTYQPNLACHYKFDANYYKANKTDSNGNLPTDYCTEYVTICTKR